MKRNEKNLALLLILFFAYSCFAFDIKKSMQEDRCYLLTLSKEIPQQKCHRYFEKCKVDISSKKKNNREWIRVSLDPKTSSKTKITYQIDFFAIPTDRDRNLFLHRSRINCKGPDCGSELKAISLMMMGEPFDFEEWYGFSQKDVEAIYDDNVTNKWAVSKLLGDDDFFTGFMKERLILGMLESSCSDPEKKKKEDEERIKKEQESKRVETERKARERSNQARMSAEKDYYDQLKSAIENEQQQLQYAQRTLQKEKENLAQEKKALDQLNAKIDSLKNAQNME